MYSVILLISSIPHISLSTKWSTQWSTHNLFFISMEIPLDTNPCSRTIKIIYLYIYSCYTRRTIKIIEQYTYIYIYTKNIFFKEKNNCFNIKYIQITKKKSIVYNHVCNLCWKLTMDHYV